MAPEQQLVAKCRRAAGISAHSHRLQEKGIKHKWPGFGSGAGKQLVTSNNLYVKKAVRNPTPGVSSLCGISASLDRPPGEQDSAHQKCCKLRSDMIKMTKISTLLLSPAKPRRMRLDAGFPPGGGGNTRTWPHVISPTLPPSRTRLLCVPQAVLIARTRVGCNSDPPAGKLRCILFPTSKG